MCRSARNCDRSDCGDQPSKARNSASTIAVAPQISTPRPERRHGERHPVAFALVVTKCRGFSSSSTPISRIRATSPSDGVRCGRARDRATIGCSRKPLTGMSSGVSAPSTRTPSSASADLLVRLAQRRLLERLARIDDAARAATPGRRAAAPRRARSGRCAPRPTMNAESRGVAERCSAASAASAFGFGKHQQQAGGVADARRVEAGRPLAARDRREPLLRRRRRAARDRQPASRAAGDGIARRITGRSSSPAQLLCGAGYELDGDRLDDFRRR